jgi:histidine ammonia-lyase
VRQVGQILDHVETIVAIELLTAAQGVDFRRKVMGVEKLGEGTAVAYDTIRAQIPFLETDTTLAPLIEQVRQLVANGTIKEAVEAKLEIED